VLGALTLWIMRSGHAFDATAKRTAQRLSQRAALGLDNARLHEQQRHIAAVLQRSLLPKALPEIPGFEVASEFLAAGEAYEVGGDFYDAFRTGATSWSVVIGDVCGKGPEAAALTSLARHTIRTASNPNRAPSSVLRTLHDSISAERSDLRFCTAALLQIDATNGNGRGTAQLTIALGGHPQPVVVRRSGKIDLLGEPGTLLGAIPDPDVSDVGARLNPGDALVLYTDGVLEARDRSLADDPKWLAGQLAEVAGRPPAEVAKKVAEAAIGRQDGSPRDDIAVIVLQRKGRA
jgi:serine phosphatase RsbU (regulator of sigma subunit)